MLKKNLTFALAIINGLLEMVDFAANMSKKMKMELPSAMEEQLKDRVLVVLTLSMSDVRMEMTAKIVSKIFTYYLN